MKLKVPFRKFTTRDKLRKYCKAKWNVGEKVWEVEDSYIEEVSAILAYYSDRNIWDTLNKKDGRIVEKMHLPEAWNWQKKEYTAILLYDEKNECFEREFITKLVNFTNSKKNAQMEYRIDVQDLDTGTIVETRIGSVKNPYRIYYRRDTEGWKEIFYFNERISSMEEVLPEFSLEN